MTTVHGVQGDTVDHGAVWVDTTSGHRALYVGMTRGRTGNHAYVVVDDDQDPLDVLRGALGRDRVDIGALATARQLAAGRSTVPTLADAKVAAWLRHRLQHVAVTQVTPAGRQFPDSRLRPTAEEDLTRELSTLISNGAALRHHLPVVDDHRGLLTDAEPRPDHNPALSGYFGPRPPRNGPDRGAEMDLGL